MLKKQIILPLLAAVILSLLLGCSALTGNPSAEHTLYNTNSLLQMAETEDAWYFLHRDGSRISRLDKDSGLYSCLLENCAAEMLISLNGVLYFINNGCEIWMVDPVSGNTETMCRLDALQRVLLPYENKLYVELGTDLYELNPKNGDYKLIRTDTHIQHSSNMAYADGWLYFNQENGLCRMHPDGSDYGLVYPAKVRFCAASSELTWCMSEEGIFTVLDAGTLTWHTRSSDGNQEPMNIVGCSDDFLFTIQGSIQDGFWLCRHAFPDLTAEPVIRLGTGSKDELNLSGYVDFWIGDGAVFFWTLEAFPEQSTEWNVSPLRSLSPGTRMYFYMISMSDLSIRKLDEFVF